MVASKSGCTRAAYATTAVTTTQYGLLPQSPLPLSLLHVSLLRLQAGFSGKSTVYQRLVRAEVADGILSKENLSIAIHALITEAVQCYIS
jgi:hypothetical protein